MELKAMICPNCGANVDIPAGQEFVTCEYCDSTLKVDSDNVKSHSHVDNHQGEYISPNRTPSREIPGNKNMDTDKESLPNFKDYMTLTRTRNACAVAIVVSLILVGESHHDAFVVLFLLAVGGTFYYNGRLRTLRRMMEKGDVKQNRSYTRTRSTYSYNIDDNRSSKDKLLALVLCIFFGFFGVHYFYVRRTGMGILYLCTFGLFWFGWIFDLFRILTGNFKDRDGLPLK